MFTYFSYLFHKGHSFGLYNKNGIVFRILGGIRMKLALMILLALAMFVLFFCGYFAGVIKEKYGKNWLQAVPITVAILMFNVIWALTELAKTERWQ